MLRQTLVKFTAAPTRASFVGLGTAMVLGFTAMAATTPVVTAGEVPAAQSSSTPRSQVTTAASATGTSSAARPATQSLVQGKPAAEAEPAVPLAERQDGHLGGRGLAVALAVAGLDVPESGLAAADVAAAASTLDVEISDPPTVADIQALVDAGWGAANHQFTLAGIHPGDAPDPSDIREAGERFGVQVGETLQPAQVAAVLAAGRADAADALTQAGIEFGDHVDVRDLEHAARELGVEYGKKMEAEDAKVVVWKARDKVKRAWEAKHHTPAFAKAAGVVLRLPSHRVEYAGFHQAAFPGVISMKKAGKAKTAVLPSRGRATSRASAIDIVQAPGEDVRAPVTGKVVEVTKYALYGKYPDVRMRIVPSDNPRAVVSVLHVEGAKVKVGDRVEGGMTVIADGPRKFPFSSQIDRFAGRKWGHVHVEIRNR